MDEQALATVGLGAAIVFVVVGAISFVVRQKRRIRV